MGKDTKTAEKKVNKYQELVDRIVTIMENNMMVPWSAGFLGGNKSLLNMVVNHSSRRPYNGGNSFILQLFGNSSSGEYITLKNAKKMYAKKEDGSDVYPKKGTHACYVIYPMIYNETRNRFWQKNDDPDKDKRVFKGYRAWKVFAIEDLNKFDTGEIKPRRKLEIRENVQKDRNAEEFIKNFVSATEVKFVEEKKPTHAFYKPADHSVHISEAKMYASDNEWYSTLFHELTHSTAKTLGRNQSMERKEYSKEEVVAEFGALLLCEYFGLRHERSEFNSATYIAGWAKSIKSNPYWLISGINNAVKAVNYMLEKAGFDGIVQATAEPMDDNIDDVDGDVA